MMKNTLSSFIFAAIGGITVIGFNHFNTPSNQINNEIPSTPVRQVNNPTNLVNAPSIDFTMAAELATNAVVNVKTSYTAKNDQYIYDPFIGLYKQHTPSENQPLGSGSGVIISQNGYIVTNNHVIENADKIEVTLNDKRVYTADLIGKDPTTDLALLKIKEEKLRFIQYGNSDNVKVGEWVLAVGNPMNLTSTVTAGIISAKARNINILENNPSKGIHSIESFLQTDAAVNPGNSGGALVNTNGELIGINSAIASRTGSYTGYSFAIPVNLVNKVMKDLIEFGEVQRAFIGVKIRDLDAKLAQEKDIEEIKGVYVEELIEGGSGEAAGIKKGDIITQIEEAYVNNVPELQEKISRFRPGDKVKVSIKRNNKNITVTLVLRNINGDTNLVKSKDIENTPILGATFETVPQNNLNKLGLRNGVQIKKLENGKLLQAGIKNGFIITKIDRQSITDINDLKTFLGTKKGGVLIEGYYPNGVKAYYGIGI